MGKYQTCSYVSESHTCTGTSDSIPCIAQSYDPNWGPNEPEECRTEEFGICQPNDPLHAGVPPRIQFLNVDATEYVTVYYKDTDCQHLQSWDRDDPIMFFPTDLGK